MISGTNNLMQPPVPSEKPVRAVLAEAIASLEAARQVADTILGAIDGTNEKQTPEPAVGQVFSIMANELRSQAQKLVSDLQRIAMRL